MDLFDQLYIDLLAASSRTQALAPHGYYYRQRFKIIFDFINNRKAMRGQDDKVGRFKQAQLGVGLRKQLFDAKFISSSNAFYLHSFADLPSQVHGFTTDDIQIVHAFASQLMHQAAKSLNVPISTLVVAQCIFHFFYARRSFLEHDVRDIMMGCMYLACKSEETLRKSYEIAIVFDYLFKVYEGDKRVNAIDFSSKEYQHIKNKTIMKAELDILFELGFEVYKLLDIPHRYIGPFLNLFEKHPKYPTICKLAWKNLNQCYYTTACLYYPHNVIAAAAVYMAMRQCGANFPQIPWWTLLEAFQQMIENVQVMVLSLRENSKKVTFSLMSQRIKQVGESYGLINVFPVPYYRKIMLQSRGKLRINKQTQEKREKVIDPGNQQMKGERKIVKVKPSEEPNNIDQVTVKNQEKLVPKQPQVPKIKIDKKNLFQSINKKLQKHEAVLNKPKKSSGSSSGSQQSQQQQMIAELKRKIKLNKQFQAQNEDDKKQ